MNPQDMPETKSYDEPLFILKYQRRKVIKRLIYFFPALFMAGLGTFDVRHPYGFTNLVLQVGSVFFLLVFILLFIDILFFDEVRLYKDRIVKVWKLLGERRRIEIELANARLRGGAGLLTNVKRIFNQGTNRLLASIKGVFYDESLADPRDVRELNGLLAHLSRRNVEEFEQPKIRMESLIEEEKT